MIHLSTSMTFAEIAEQSALMKQMQPWFISGDTSGTDSPICIIGDDNANNVIDGLLHMQAVSDSGVTIAHDIYTDEEKRLSPDKGGTKLFYFPGEPGKPFVVICPGGGYFQVVPYGEGFPIARVLNQLGINAFVLSYRTNELRLLPKPMDDLAQAVRFIRDHSRQFQVDANRYAVMGFSAGGHLAGQWGTNLHGYATYGLPKPEALMLAYPSTSTDVCIDDIEAGIAEEYVLQLTKAFLSMIGGADYTRESLHEYCVERHIDANYPPTYLVHCEDDPLVSHRTAVLLDNQLAAMDIPHMFRSAKRGEHGFGVGIGTDAEGWIEEAVSFWNCVKNR